MFSILIIPSRRTTRLVSLLQHLRNIPECIVITFVNHDVAIANSLFE